MSATHSTLIGAVASFVAARRFAEAARHYRTCLTGYVETGDASLRSPLAGLARVAIEAGRPTSAAQPFSATDA